MRHRGQTSVESSRVRSPPGAAAATAAAASFTLRVRSDVSCSSLPSCVNHQFLFLALAIVMVEQLDVKQQPDAEQPVQHDRKPPRRK